METKDMIKPALAIAALILAGTTAHADQQSAAPSSAATTMTAVAPAPEQTQATLNQTEANAAAQQLSQDQANQQHHDAAMAHWQNNVAQYHEEARDQRADTAEYHHDMARWQADVAACKAGDSSRCAPTP